MVKMQLYCDRCNKILNEVTVQQGESLIDGTYDLEHGVKPHGIVLIDDDIANGKCALRLCDKCFHEIREFYIKGEVNKDASEV